MRHLSPQKKSRIFFFSLSFREGGFTLLEILVVVSIIVILTSFVMINHREGEKQFALLRSAHKLAQDIRNVQELAMAGKRLDGVFPRGGYGIYLEEGANSYILFADCNGNKEYDPGDNEFIGCASSTEEIGQIFPETREEPVFESKVEIGTLFPFSPLHIVFYPPDPTITITPSASSSLITLSLGGHSRTVYINTLGLIDID